MQTFRYLHTFFYRFDNVLLFLHYICLIKVIDVRKLISRIVDVTYYYRILENENERNKSDSFD